MVGGRPSRARRITLRNNGIRSRYYAIDPVSGAATHTNAQLTAAAARHALDQSNFRVADLDLLACGTSSPDQIMPGHGSMVHAELGGHALEVVSTAGVCGAGMMALKHAYLSIRSGESRHALATASELASSFMCTRNFAEESDTAIDTAEKHPGLGFEKDFLRWMLSDGAAAALLASKPIADRLALRIEWIEGLSFSHELLVSMYSGAVKRSDGALLGWRQAPATSDLIREHYFSVKQDARLLDQYIPRLIAKDTIIAFAARHDLRTSQVDWFLPHYSSEYFRAPLARSLARVGFPIPADRWFSNLPTVGNVGSAANLLMLEELFHSGKLRHGQKILCFVPESARFSVYFMLLQVV